jgi:hypothetical protein
MLLRELKCCRVGGFAFEDEEDVVVADVGGVGPRDRRAVLVAIGARESTVATVSE